MPNTPTLEVNLSAIADNYQLLRSRLHDRLGAAVVKANAYGLGMGAVSGRLWQEGCRQFFVATLAEAVELRRVLPEATIYVFQGTLPGEEKDMLHHRLIPVLNSIEQVERWEKSANGASAMLHIDTGMTRLGLNETEAMALASQPERVRRAGIECIMSHLACAHEGMHEKNTEQLDRFKKAFALFPQPIGACLANSAGIFLGNEYHYDMARPGCALYGINPTPDANCMRPVVDLSAPIIQIRTLDRDETVGYSATHKSQKGGRLAIVGMGYADGIMRYMSSKGFGYIGGHKAPIVGRISMDMLALDVSHIPPAAIPPSARAELINEQQDVNVIADLCGTIGYEILTRIGERVRRIYK